MLDTPWGEQQIMAQAGKLVAPSVVIDPNYRLLLRKLARDAHGWMTAANGHNDSFNNPIGRMLAKDLARQELDRYFKAIDDLVPKEPT
jgi:hypothetical protein